MSESAVLKASLFLRTILHSALIVLMFLSPLQASVHTALMSNQEMTDDSLVTPMALGHNLHEIGGQFGQAEHDKHPGHSDLPCMELCLLVSIVPTIPLVESPATGISPTSLQGGKPLKPANPTAPPPKQFLL